jgi:hypothetical protein
MQQMMWYRMKPLTGVWAIVSIPIRWALVSTSVLSAQVLCFREPGETVVNIHVHWHRSVVIGVYTLGSLVSIVLCHVFHVRHTNSHWLILRNIRSDVVKPYLAEIVRPVFGKQHDNKGIRCRS